MRQLTDLILDAPDAPVMLGNFMARAIADDCIPPKFLHSYKGQVDALEAKKALTKADTLLSMKHGLVRWVGHFRRGLLIIGGGPSIYDVHTPQPANSLY